MTMNKKAKAVDRSNEAKPDAMLRAVQKATSAKTSAYYFGNLGDSIERRFNGNGGGLGGNSDLYHGSQGIGNSYNAVGWGNFYGTGQGFGTEGRGGPGGGGQGGFNYLSNYSKNSSFNHYIISQCILAYLGHGVIRNIVDLYSDFATEGLQISHPNESVENFYKHWAKQVNLNQTVHSIFTNMFLTGNVFVHKTWATLTNAEKNTMKRAKSSQLINDNLVVRLKTTDRIIKGNVDPIDHFLQNKAFALDMKERAKSADKESNNDQSTPKPNGVKMPWNYTVLNPLQMDIRGKKIKGEHRWVMLLDRNDTKDISESMGYQGNNISKTKINIPKEFLKRVSPLSKPHGGYVAEIEIDSNSLSVIQDRKFDWFDWSVPFVYPALRAISFKDCLRNMEVKACESVINSIFLFKLGDIDKGFVAEDEHFERLADMLQVPGNVMNIIWNEAIEAQVIQADIKGVFDPKKHESADRDILTALGVPEVLLGGKGGNFSNSFIAVSTILEKLETARNIVKDWLMGEISVISEAMNFKRLPDVKFGATSLTDRKSEQNFLLQLFDRGILSDETILSYADTDPEIESLRQEREKKYEGGKKTKKMQKRGPYIKDDVPKAGINKGTTGRPSGSDTGETGEQENKRAPKGQSLADIDKVFRLHTLGNALIDSYEGKIHNGYLKSVGKKYIKQCSQGDREGLEKLTYHALANTPHDIGSIEDGLEFLKSFLVKSDINDMNNACSDVYQESIRVYVAENGSGPVKSDRKHMMALAWSKASLMF